MTDPYIPTEQDYRTYQLLRADGFSNSAMVAHFGARKAASLSLRYQAEKAAGLIRTSFSDDSKPAKPQTWIGRVEWDRTLS